jgi:hypothetical protein
MSLHSASYFAGVGTVVATMALGFGGGVLLTDAFVGKSERTPTLMERRAAPLSESTAPSVAAAPAPQTSEQQTAATVPVAPAPQPQTAAQTIDQRPPIAVQAAAPPPTTQTTTPQPTSPLQQQQAAPSAQASNSTPATDERARFEQSMGRAQDADLTNRAAEAKKAIAAERRKQERRKWAERRKQDMQKLDELTAIAEKVKQAERGREREPVFRSFAAESPTIRRSPITTLFGDPED